MKQNLFFLILFLISTGCHKKEINLQKQIKLPESFNNSKTSNHSDKLQNFFERFKDPALENLIDKAFNNNPDLMSAVSNLNKSGFIKKQAVSGLFPSASITGSASKQREMDADPEKTSRTFSLSGKLSYEIDFFSKLNNQKTISEISEKQSIEDIRIIYSEIAFEICELYFTLISLEQKLEILKKKLELLNSQKDISEKRYQSGLTGMEPVLASRAKLEEVNAGIIENRRIKEMVLSSLGILTGSFEKEKINTENKLPDTDNILSADIPSQTIMKRPDVKKAFFELEKKNLYAAVRAAERFPSFSLSAEIGRARIDNSPVPPVYTSFASIGASFLAPVFDYGKRKALYNEAVSDWESYFFQYKKTVITAFREVEDSIHDRAKYSVETDKTSELIKHLEKNAALSAGKYHLGIITISEVIEDELKLIEPRSKLVDLKLLEIKSMLYFAKASGLIPDDVQLNEVIENMTEKNR